MVLFIFTINPIYNIFIFMLICIQSFIFLALFPKQYFFAFLLLIIYLGAIAVLFLFVVLVIGNSGFFVSNTTKYSNNIIKISENYLFFFIFLLFFLNVSTRLFYEFCEWIIDFEVNSELGIYKDYINYLKDLNFFIQKNFINLDNFLFYSDDSNENLFEKIGYSINESSCYNFVNAFCKPELFSFAETNSDFVRLQYWGAVLFLRDSGILFLSAFILFLSTIGVIVLVINRKQIFKTLS